MPDKVPTIEEIEKKVDGLTATLASANARADRAEFVSKLDSKDFEVYKALDDSEQAEFAKCETDQCRLDILSKRKAKMAGMMDDDEEEKVEKRLTDISKKLDEQVELNKSLTTRLQAAEDIAKTEINNRKMVEFKKRANEEFGSLPGTVEERAEVLKILDSKLTPEEVTKVTTLLSAGNAALNSVTKQIGRDGGAGSSIGAWATIEKKAEALSKEKNISKAAAVDAVLQDNPELYTQYLQEGERRS